jgi:hypothetical protein
MISAGPWGGIWAARERPDSPGRTGINKSDPRVSFLSNGVNFYHRIIYENR